MRRLSVFLILCCWFAGNLLACPFDDPDAKLWDLMGKPAYTTSSFGESRGTRYHAGVDFSTNMEEGWPVLAPTDGEVVELRESPYGYGKALLYAKPDGEYTFLWAHLSSFNPKIQALFDSVKAVTQKNELRWTVPQELRAQLTYEEYEVLAYSGSSGIGNPHLHFEQREDHNTKLENPCAKIWCHDSIDPQILGAMVWDAANAQKLPVFTQQSSLDSGFIAVDPSFREPMLALKIVDYSRAPYENPMSIFKIAIRQGTRLLYKKEYEHLWYGSTMKNVVEELLWTEEADTAGDWHLIHQPQTPNKNVEHWDASFPLLLRQYANTDIQKQQPLTIEVIDVRVRRYPTIKFRIRPVDSTAAQPPFPLVKAQDSVLFTALARTWIDLGQCAQTTLKIKTSDQKELDLCQNNSLRHPVPLSYLLPSTLKKGLLAIGSQRQVHFLNIPTGFSQKMLLKAEGIKMQVYPTALLWPQVVTWEAQNHEKDMSKTFEIHPKGLALERSVEFCLEHKDSVSQQELYYLGETSRKWIHFSKQHRHEDSKSKRVVSCGKMDEIRDLTLFEDTIAPDLGPVVLDSVSRFGKWEPAYRLTVIESGSGIASGNDIVAEQGKRWIPVEYDSQPQQLVIRCADVTPGEIQIQIQDEAGQSQQIIRTLPSCGGTK